MESTKNTCYPTISEDQLLREVAVSIPLNRFTVQAVLLSTAEITAHFISCGHPVRVPGLGVVKPDFTIRRADPLKGEWRDTVTARHLVLQPAKELTEALNQIKLKT